MHELEKDKLLFTVENILQENAQILDELEKQSFKQNVQIVQSMAETAALSEQLANANKQLDDMKKEIAKLKKEDTKRR